MSQEHLTQERRRFKRLEVSFTVLFKVDSPLEVRMKVGDREINALALDLSEGGMAILTEYSIPASTTVTIRFIMQNESNMSAESRARSVLAGGEVRYNTLLEKQMIYRLGVAFTGLSDEDRKFIADFVKLKLYTLASCLDWFSRQNISPCQ